MARLELPTRMDHTKVFPQVLDLKFALGSAVKVEFELDRSITVSVSDCAVTRFGRLLALNHHLKNAVLGLDQYRFWNLDEFVRVVCRTRFRLAEIA